jgi:ferric-dicitrate binding protein FerR (iron transport regulator)
MIKNSDFELIEKYLRGECSREEEIVVASFFSEYEDDAALRHHIQQTWNNLVEPIIDDQKLSHILDHLHHVIRLKEQQIQKGSVTRRIYRYYSLIAAILMIPVILAGAIWIIYLGSNISEMKQEYVRNTIYAPLGSRISFTLPDSTKGWLNSGSELVYNLPFKSGRNVVLKGEAWFDVAHNAKSPFIVEAGIAKVKVLGTRFNVNAYPSENYVEVVLEEGKVEFSVGTNGTVVNLKPDERLVFSNNEIKVNNTDAWKYNGWKEGKLIFRGDSMLEVARRVERWYNVEVDIKDKELESYTFRGTFQDDSLEEVLKYLSMTSPIRYKISERKINDDGTYVKQKIILYKK